MSIVKENTAAVDGFREDNQVLFYVFLMFIVLFEELLFRGYIQTRLQQVGLNNISVIVFSALIFSLAHIY